MAKNQSPHRWTTDGVHGVVTGKSASSRLLSQCVRLEAVPHNPANGQRHCITASNTVLATLKTPPICIRLEFGVSLFVERALNSISWPYTLPHNNCPVQTRFRIHPSIFRSPLSVGWRESRVLPKTELLTRPCKNPGPGVPSAGGSKSDHQFTVIHLPMNPQSVRAPVHGEV